MSENIVSQIADIQNEKTLDFAPGSPERKSLEATLKAFKSEEKQIPMIIDGKEVFTQNTKSLHPPHMTSHTLGHYHEAEPQHILQAIEAAQKAKPQWQALNWEDRAAIFLKVADLISNKYRMHINAATMLGQSKTIHQSEIDAVCELADFMRFNVAYMREMFAQQPSSTHRILNRVDYRPLEGFVMAITPFNFTAIAANLPAAPAMLGNTVVWKPADSQIYAAHLTMKIFQEAGLPDGVINLVYGDGPMIGKHVFAHKDFAGLHFTGSTVVFRKLWQIIGENLANYKSYPRIVGETGGKDFVIAHSTADVDQVVANLIRGAFEFQGQKCSAASRAYIPKSLWPEIKSKLVEEVATIKVGDVEDYTNFMGAVIDQNAFDKISGYIDHINEDKSVEVITGGSYDSSEGYFIQPTIVQVQDPHYKTMEEEIFGPVLSIYVYEDDQFEEALELVDTTSPYALTGAIFARDTYVVRHAVDRLRYAAGNFYINDKPTGAVVNQQPFGGGRASGTNDKAGSIMNLYRWVSPRTVKANLGTPTDYRYPFMG